MDFDTTQNIFIESDNLEALKILQKSYAGKIKMIYIDPPYNTGNDFIYHDDFSQSKKEYEIATGDRNINGELLKSFKKNSKDNGHYHSNWLNMMLPRLHLAHTLLSDDGVIFISIDDNEQAQLKLLCDEIFGGENFIGSVPRITKKAGKTSGSIAKNHDYILIYAKSDLLEFVQELHTDKGYKYKDEHYDKRGAYKLSQTLDYSSIQYSQSLDYEINLNGKIFRAGNVSHSEMLERIERNPNSDFCWRWSKKLFDFGLENGFIVVKGDRIYTKTYENAKIEKCENDYIIIYESRTKVFSTLEMVDNSYSNDNSRKDIEKIFGAKLFEYTKPVSMLIKLLKIATNKNSITLDFFAGSATTAHAVMQLNSEDNGNRQFIMVQLPELTDEKSEAYKAGFKTISDISKERIRRAGAKIKAENPDKALDIGFKVFKLSDSNFKAWQIDDDDIAKQLEMYIDLLKDNANEMDIVYELLLKMGLKLTADIHFEKGVYWLTCENKSYAIVLNSLSQDEFHAIIAKKPAKTVVLDKAFLNDSEKSNVILQFKDAGLNFESI
ncbi:site-specific DNA-methyltransferase [Moraxella lacunata]|uniref:site-specific DNA-methyltransferase n=2 Tax=Moraxella TaxID=475 RepID=UPI0038992553